MGTVSIELPLLRAAQLEHLDGWLRSVLWESTLPKRPVSASTANSSNFSVYRLKGRLALDTGQVKMIQGVREVYEIIDAPPASSVQQKGGKLVLIGRNVAGLPWAESLDDALTAR